MLLRSAFDVRDVDAQPQPPRRTLAHLDRRRESDRHAARRSHRSSPRATLSLIINGCAGVTAKIDLPLNQVLATRERLWLDLQKQRDLWIAKQTKAPRTKRLVLAETQPEAASYQVVYGGPAESWPPASLKGMVMLNALLDRGYFPKELPPMFTTSSFATAMGATGSVLPDACTKTTAIWTKATHHNLARVGGLRRRLSVPNPLSFFRLARAFAQHEALLTAKWNESPYSATKPELDPFGGRALDRGHSDRASRRVAARLGARYLLKADVAQFYPSIFTHTVPWAIHGKPQAKLAIKNVLLAGNIIDKELQACQSGQTKGISIGPDTSLGIAELLLAPIDARLKRECNVVGGLRFIDDMEYSFRRLADAEDALYRLKEFLHEYELQLNGTKTLISALPEPLESKFVTDLRRQIPASDNQSRSMWIDFFSTAFALAKLHPQDGVLRYAISALTNVQVQKRQWEMVQSLLWQTLVSDPGCLRFIIDYVWILTHRNSELAIDQTMAAAAISSLVESSAAVGHGSEVAWSMWAASLFSLQLSDDAWNAAHQMDDSFVAVATLTAAEKLGIEMHSSKWAGWLEEGCFEESQWLFVYEAFRRGWCNDQLAFAKLHAEPFCKFMFDNAVSFVDKDIVASYRPSRFIVCGGGGGGGGGSG